MGGVKGGSNVGGGPAGGTSGAAGAGGEGVADSDDANRWATGATLYVDDDPGCEGFVPCYRTLEDARSAAKHGDTILVLPGSYAGMRFGQYKNLGSLRILGRDGPATTTITGPCFKIFSEAHPPGEIWVEGFTFRDCGPATASSADGWGLYISAQSAADVQVRNNVFGDQNGSGGLDLYSLGNARVHVVVTGNRFLNERKRDDNWGQFWAALFLDLSGSSERDDDVYVRVENNLFAGNAVGAS
ncbi:MAG TPA: hypothetical protein VFQ35_25405, partial [Polyangiaceae bacterium]|nr:hypothetical protein [Polyangiaceae bacterium]